MNEKGPQADPSAHNYIRMERIHVNAEPKAGDLALSGTVENWEYYGLYIKYYIRMIPVVTIIIFSFRTYGAIRTKRLDLSRWTLVNFFGSQDYQYLTNRGTYKVGLYLRPLRQRVHPQRHTSQLFDIRHCRGSDLRHCGGGLQLYLQKTQ